MDNTMWIIPEWSWIRHCIQVYCCYFLIEWLEELIIQALGHYWVEPDLAFETPI